MRSILFTLLFVVAPHARAGLLIEPYAGYAFGTARPTGVPSTHQNGVAYGARAGYQMLGAMAGVDYQTGRWTDSASPRNDLTPSNLGVFVGYNLPILLRAYIEYIPLARLTAEHTAFEHTYDGGEAVKYGLGWTGFPFVSVNFEYVNAHFRGLDSEMYALNVSLPLVF